MEAILNWVADVQACISITARFDLSTAFFFLSLTLPFSACLHLWPFPSFAWSALLCCSATQRIEEPWLVQSARRPSVSFKPGPNKKKCLLSFSLLPFEVPHFLKEGWLWRRWHHTLLCCASPTFAKKDTGGLKGSGAVVVFVYLWILCCSVGVCVDVRVLIGCAAVAVGIKWLASIWAEMTVMYISFQGQQEIYHILLRAVAVWHSRAYIASTMCGDQHFVFPAWFPSNKRRLVNYLSNIHFLMSGEWWHQKKNYYASNVSSDISV